MSASARERLARWGLAALILSTSPAVALWSSSGLETVPFALALFVKNSLHAFTVTLGVESERLPTVPAVNQVQLTRRARAEEPASESELEEEMERLVYAVLQCAVNNGLLMLCAEAVGIMQALIETTVEYTNTRKQFSVPLSTFQVLRHRMTDMFIDYQRTDALLESVALQSGEDTAQAQRSALAITSAT